MRDSTNGCGGGGAVGDDRSALDRRQDSLKEGRKESLANEVHDGALKCDKSNVTRSCKTYSATRRLNDISEDTMSHVLMSCERVNFLNGKTWGFGEFLG